MNVNYLKVIAIGVLVMADGGVVLGQIVDGVNKNQPVTTQGVMAAWTSRQERTSTGDFEWEETITYPKGGMTGRLYGVPESLEYPKEDKILKANSQIIFDRKRMNYSYNSYTWDTNLRDVVRRKAVGVFDGENSKQLLYHEDTKYPNGLVLDGKFQPEYNSLNVAVLIMHFRPLQSGYGQTFIEKCSTDSKLVNVRGKTCAVVKQVLNGIVQEWYVDPEMDFSIIRYEMQARKNPAMKVDVDYVQSADVGWIPVKWHAVSYDPTKKFTITDIKGTMNHYQFNRPVDESKLTLDFPKNSIVYDLRKRDGYKYIQRGDGSHRKVTEEELRRGATMEQLINSDSGMGGLSAKPTWRPIAILALVVTSIMLLITIVVKKIRGIQT